MGEHTAAQPSKLREAVYWAVAHRRKILSAVIVALPLVSRYVPDFPSDTVVTLLRTYLGA